MFIVYAKNSFTLLGKEYFGTDGKQIVGFHDPRRASHFHTKKEAEEFCELFDYPDRKIGTLDKEAKAFEKCNFVYRKMPMLDPELNTPYNPNVHTREDVLAWRRKVGEAPERAVSSKVYSTWPNLYSLFKHIFNEANYHRKDNRQNLFFSFSLKVDRYDEFQIFEEELKKVLPLCTYEEKGEKRFPIFDHELSAGGTSYFVYKSDKECKIESGSFGFVEVEGDLEYVFDYWKVHRYYQ